MATKGSASKLICTRLGRHAVCQEDTSGPVIGGGDEPYHREPRRTSAHQAGVTVLELLLAVALIGTLVAMVIPQTLESRRKLRITQAVIAIRSIEEEINAYINDYGVPPDTLAQAGISTPLDPWGHPYQYLKIFGGGPGVNGHSRKDHNMVPVNSDYDLYSMGPDGKSRPPFTAKASRDDIVRASNGGYVGPVADF